MPSRIINVLQPQIANYYPVYRLEGEGRAGVDHFIVDENKEYEQTTRSFWMVRPHGLMEASSFYHYIKPKRS